ncbi:MAG TPA: glycoside hydrolase N-terminal domain-containing protein, partial [Candidatus Hydrogenedentes bacterium]|nr:glycoside hydrolase N-terminal domain-containing protein [Candidatus Hydrogenedentota bacterium]
MTFLLPLMVCAAAAAPADAPWMNPAHDLFYEKPATVWDEAFPLGNAILGALVWGDGTPLRISLDRTDLWDLRPVPEYHSPEYTYATIRQWEKEGRVK